MAAIAIVAIMACAVKLSAPHAKDARAVNPGSVKSQVPALSNEQRGRIRASLDALPLAFEANQGQADPQVRYMARGNGYSVFLTGKDAVFAISSAKHPQSSRTAGPHSQTQSTEKVQSAAIDMRLVGGNSKPEITAGNELPGTVNYYVGSNPKDWHTGVKQYSSVSYREVYPGVNMVLHGAQRQLEFDFVVRPGADPKTIVLGFKGARKLETDASGNLVLTSSAGDVALHKPVAYQEKDGKREIVEAAFLIHGSDVGLNLGTYDRGRELVIDPILSYATYLGGTAEDDALAIAVDGSGNAYITGQTVSPLFGGKTAGPNFDVFVTKVNTTGTALAYTAIFAATNTGAGNCSGNTITVDSAGNAYVAGSATIGFPLVSALQNLFAGGPLDAFVLKLNSTGTAVQFSTYLGGSATDIANGIAVDGSGNVYIAGDTSSNDLNPTSNAIQGSLNGSDDAFMAKLDSSGSSLLYLTYLGGSSSDLATGMAIDGSNNAYLAGVTLSTDFPISSGAFQTTAGGSGDAFVAKINADGTRGYATYLGGSAGDNGFGITVDSAGEAYVTGTTNSSNFPTLNAAQGTAKGAVESFVTKLNASGSGLLFSTYLGGTLDDSAVGIALDSFGDAYVTGRTFSSDFPVTDGGTIQGSTDAFVAELSNTGDVVYASFIGGNLAEDTLGGGTGSGAVGAVAVDSTSNAYLTGTTDSTASFPVTNGVLQANFAGGQADGFVVKVGAAPADFSVGVSPGNASVTSGQTTSAITVTVSSVNSSLGQAVTLSCGNLPSKAVCHFSPASVTPGSSAQTSSLTISTNGSSSASMHLPSANRQMQVFAAVFLPLVGITLLAAGTNREKKRLFGFLLLGLLLSSLMILPACAGGGGDGGGGGGGGGGGTTPGTYNIMVSGAGGGANHSAAFTLKVN